MCVCGDVCDEAIEGGAYYSAEKIHRCNMRINIVLLLWKQCGRKR